MTSSTSRRRRLPTYFGFVETSSKPLNEGGCGTNNNDTRVLILDDLSGTSTHFALPTNDQKGIDQLGATEQHILLLDHPEQCAGTLWLYRIQTQATYKLSLDGIGTDNWRPAFTKAKQIFTMQFDDYLSLSQSLLGTTTSAGNEEEAKEEEARRLQNQFSHWKDFQQRGWEEAVNEEGKGESLQTQRRYFLACTAFGVFLAVNRPDNSAILQCIYRHETPLIDADEHTDTNADANPCCSTAEEKSPNQQQSTEHFLPIRLPFNVKQLCAGQDHLALLNHLGNVYTLGTGTRGELGHGRVEQGYWTEAKLVEDLVEGEIRVLQISCGAWHTVALTDGGDLYGWGWNEHGQLGVPKQEFYIQPLPYPFDIGDSEVQLVHCAHNNTFVLFTNGQRRVFGESAEEHKTTAKPMEGEGEKSGAVTNQEEEKEMLLNKCEQEGKKDDEKHVAAENEQQKPGAAEAEQSSSTTTSTSPLAKRPRQQRKLHLAVAGCSHGQMDTIYERLAYVERQRNMKFDLLICCGDFQAVRNHGDLHYFHAPPHHRKLGTFYKYYSGEKTAPVLTLFVGGNHESSGYMAELPNGGWVAPNIYFMGYASVVQFAGLRIAGLSGIYKSNDYNRGHFERPPFYERGSIVSAYHVRSVDVFRLQQLRDTKVDICVSHDWPAGITDFGDRQWLLRIKPHFTEDVQHNRLGNPATMNLLYDLKPAHWFAAHMHVRFTAVVPHSSSSSSGADGERKEEAKVLAAATASGPETAVTRFVALDKPVQDNNRRHFLEFMELPVEEDAPMELSYDPYWLAILKATDALTEFTDHTVYMPNKVPGSQERHDFRPNADELEAVQTAFGGNFRVPLNFQRTAPPETQPWRAKGQPPAMASQYYRNPQSQQFCERLGIRDLNLMFAQASTNCLGIPHFIEEARLAATATAQSTGGNGRAVEEATKNPEEIDLGTEEDEFGGEDFVVDVSGAGNGK